jgi:hypothetical protein
MNHSIDVLDSLVERILTQGDLKVKILQFKGKSQFDRENNPTRETLQKHLEAVASKLNVSLPTIALETTSAERRYLERKVIDHTLRTYLNLSQNETIPYDTDWLPSGKPYFAATPDSGLQVSVSHDTSYCFCAVGHTSQGCSLLLIRKFNQEEWLDSFGANQEALLSGLLLNDCSVDVASVRIQSAITAIRNASENCDDILLSIERRDESAVLFKALDARRTAFFVLTLPIYFSNMEQSMIALVVEKRAVAKYFEKKAA